MSTSRFFIAPLAATRSLLSVNGIDSAKFLQGLVSNDIPVPSSSSSSAVYAGFFSAQGRVLHDTFILPTTSASSSSSLDSGLSDSTHHFLIDHPRKVSSPALLAYIKRYILRSKVKANIVDDQWRLWAVFQDPLDADHLMARGSAVEEELQHLAGSGKGHWWTDKRSSRMGYRLLLPPSASSSSIDASTFTSCLPAYHTLLRTLSNVPEAPTDLIPNQALPLESNMDIMGGIDFRKGCYIGQELTARTYHTGVIRKRIVPVRLFRPEESSPSTLLPTSWTSITSVSEISGLTNDDIQPLSSSPSTEIGRSRRARSAGRLGSLLRVIGNQGNKEAEEEVYLGLALLRLEVADGDLGLDLDEHRIDGDAKDSGNDEAGVSAAGGMVREKATANNEADSIKGQWRVKAFKQSLGGAK